MPSMRGSAAGAVLALALAGCTPQQQAQANQSARDAGQAAQQVANTAVKATQTAAAKAEQALSDASLTGKVKTAMGASAKLTTSGIDVDTKNHVVTLKGRVPDTAQKALAERIARDTVGPDMKVVNQLQVAPPGPKR